MLAGRGESYDDLALPEQEDGGVLPADDVFSAPKADADLDFSAFLDSIPDDLGSLPETPDTPEPLEALEPPDSLEAPDSLDSLEPMNSFDALEAPEPASTDESEGGFPEDLLSGFAAEIEAEHEAADSGADTGLDTAAFELPDDLGSGLEDLDFAEPVDETPVELPAEETPADESFSLFSEGIPETEDAAEDALPAMESAVPAAADEEYDFSIPDFESSAPKDEPTVDELSLDDTPLDSFDTFSLDESSLSGSFGLQDTQKAGPSPGFAKLEEFSLSGIDDVFGSPAAGSEPFAAGLTGGPAAQEVEEIHLSDDEYKQLEATLAGYPLNLRIACEELIAEHAVAPDLMSTLVKQLVRGAGAKETASLAGKILGRSIVIPRGFEKRSGAELEAEQATFTYAFVHHFLPFLRVFAFIALIVASVVYLSFEFIYTPLRAEAIYKQGYERIAGGDYARAEERFSEAFGIKRKKSWFYAYAEEYRRVNQYIEAQKKYDSLLRWYPRDKKGTLDYAGMERDTLHNYEKADALIRHNILDYQVDDREGLLALGDTNLAWGEIEPSRYEEARSAYARLMARYGRKDEFLERMLKYFIRTDQLAEVLSLQLYFMESDSRRISAAGLAELGGYLLDKKIQETKGVPDQNISKIEGLKELLERAVKQDAADPEARYHLARYFNRFGSPQEERRSLEQALTSFGQAEERSARRIGYHIDAFRRYGDVLIQGREFISAEQELANGVEVYEDAVRRRILARSAQFGSLYASLGDLEYFNNGDLAQALNYYRKAEQDGWAPPEMLYRMGSASYSLREWSAALESFFAASAQSPLNRRLLFALGNATYLRGDLHAAQGYYSRLLDTLEAERARFPVLLPNDRPEHMDLAERIMRARNNLGVTLEALADRAGAGPLRSRALALYAESARTWDAITRNPTTMVRSGEAGYERQIFMEIDKDVLEPSPWEKLLAP